MSALTIANLGKELSIAVPYIDKENSYLNVPLVLLNPLKDALKNWQTLYPQYEDVNKRTKETIAEFKELRITADKNLRAMKQNVKHSGVVLRPDDYLNLFITKRKTSTPIPAPTMLVDLTVIVQERAAVKLQASNASLPEFNHETIISKDIKFVNVYVVIKDADDHTEPTPEEYVTAQRFTTATFLVKFSEDDIQKTAWLRASVANPTGDEGPKGKPIKVVVSN